MIKTTTREMKSKTATIAAGERVTVAFDVESGIPRPLDAPSEKSASRFSVKTADGRRIVTRDFKAVGFKVPSVATLERYMNDKCKSVFGAETDPDGWDGKGSPSWLLALGMM